MSRRQGIAGLALLGLITSVALMLEGPIWPRSSPGLGFLQDGPARLFEGRPGSGTKSDWYAPLHDPAVKPTSMQSVAFAAARTHPSQDSDRLTERGLIQLSFGDAAGAIANFKAASNREPNDNGKLTNIAVAYLARYQAEQKPTDLLFALEYSQQAWKLAPQSAPACFTHSLVLSKLGLRTQAVRAWRRYLALDPSSPWSDEALANLEKLTASTVAERWDTQRQTIESSTLPPTRIQIEELIKLSPYKSRTWAEEDLLGKWAQLWPSTESLRTLETASVLAGVLSEQYNSRLLLDSIQVIEDALSENDQHRLRLLAEGHSAYLRASERYAKQDMAEAVRLFSKSTAAFGKAGSPFGTWPKIHLAIAAYYSNSTVGGKQLQSLLHDLPEGQYDDVRGRIYWLLGIVEVVNEKPEVALNNYRYAFNLLGGSLGPSATVYLQTVQAEALGRIGEVEESWRMRIDSLNQISELNDPRRMHSAIMEAVQMLIRQGLFDLTDPFLKELRQNAEDWGNATATMEAYLHQAKVDLKLGDVLRADRSLQSASAALSLVPDNPVRRYLELSVDSEVAQVRATLNPAEGTAILDRVIQRQSENRNYFDFIRLTIARANMHLQNGDKEGAQEDLEKAIASYESLRSGIGDEQLRITAFSQAQPAFDTYMSILASDEKNSVRMFELAERARTRFLLDLRRKATQDSTTPIKPSTASDLTRLPPGTKILMYYVLDHQLLTWLIDQSSIHFQIQNIDARFLEAKVSTLRDDIERRASNSAIEAAAADLSMILTQPFAKDLAGATHLIFIPDRFLQRIPFFTLSDPETKRLLIEDFPVSLAPSATLLLGGAHSPSRFLPKALVVGAPAIDTAVFPDLKELKDAREEAREIAALYSNGLLLEGGQATESTILDKLDLFEVFHFAGHAQANASSIRLSRLLLAPDPKADGILHAKELPNKLKRTRLVVLSACRTLDSTSRDREDLFGLASVFLSAGASTVVASLWNADDLQTKTLMVDFHRQFAAGSPAEEALRKSALFLRNNGLPARYWSVFEPVTSICN